MSTPRQMELLAFIRRFAAENDGAAPSFEEMRNALSLRSKTNIFRLIEELEAQGLIRRRPHRARSIEVIDRPDAIETLTRLIAHWDRSGAEGIGPLIERARRAVA